MSAGFSSALNTSELDDGNDAQVVPGVAPLSSANIAAASPKTTVPFVRVDSFARKGGLAAAGSVRSGMFEAETTYSTLPHNSQSASQATSFSSVKPGPTPSNLQGKLFHAMISYRVASEGDGGNGLSLQLYREIHRLSVSTCPIPLGAEGQWPKFARRPETILEGQAKVYLDVCCLVDGEPWERGASGRGGFVGGVSASIVFVPLLSWYEDDAGFVGRMCGLESSDGRDWVDNCLLEIVVALELLQVPSANLSAILPIYVGDKDKTGRFGAFPFHNIVKLSKNPSHLTNQRALEVLQLLGVAEHLAPGQNGESGVERMMQRSVRQAIEEVGKNQGVQLVMEGIAGKAVTSAATRVLGVVAERAKKVGVQCARSQLLLDRFLLGRPQAHEVQDWLVANRLTKYASVLAAHGIDTLRLLSQLATHTSALDEIHQETAAVMAEESNTEPRLLWGDLNRLRDRVSRISAEESALLQERYDKFKDNENSTMAGTFTSQGPECAIGASVYMFMIPLNGGVSAFIAYVTLSRQLAYDGSQLVWSQDGVEYGSFGKVVLRWGLVFNVAINPIVSLICLAMFWRGLLKHDKGQWRRKLVTLLTLLYAIWPLIVVAIDRTQCAQLVGIWEFCDGYPTYYLPVSACWWCTFFCLIHFPGFYWTMLQITLSVGFGIAGFLYGNTFYQQCLMVTFTTITLSSLWYLRTLLRAKTMVRSDMYEHRKAYSELVNKSGPEGQRALDQMTAVARRVNAWGEVELRRQRTPGYWLKRSVGLVSPMVGNKVRQLTSNLDELMDLASEVNYHFQDLVVAWCPHGAEYIPGPVKRPLRAMQKARRDYRGDVACLTDLVRCSIVCPGLPEALETLETIISKCSSDDAPVSAKYERLSTDVDKIMRVHRVKNRLDPAYDDKQSAGYRDISLQVEIGWIVSKDGMCWFVPVAHWGNSPVKVDRLVCEIQIQVVNSVHSEKFYDKHERYLRYRNTMGK